MKRKKLAARLAPSPAHLIYCLQKSESSIFLLFLFFFQAEDGIRARTVTGVQTCALPIWRVARVGRVGHAEPRARGLPASPDRAPMSFPRRAGLYAGDRLTEGWRHAETDLRHEPDPGRATSPRPATTSA